MGLLDDKAAIATGSVRGIGRATAELFASQGEKALINDLDGDAASAPDSWHHAARAVQARRKGPLA